LQSVIFSSNKYLVKQVAYKVEYDSFERSNVAHAEQIRALESFFATTLILRKERSARILQEITAVVIRETVDTGVVYCGHKRILSIIKR
jgi:hypothetical protein